MDEIGSGFFRLIWGVVFEIFFLTVCYWIGWPVCKIITLGRYPATGSRAFYEHSSNEEGWLCSLVGLVTLFGSFAIFISLVA